MFMKKCLLLFIFTLIIYVVSAQVSFSVNVAEPFGLSSAIAEAGGNLSAITNLTVTGTIDAFDFKIMRDDMPALTVVDLTGVSIAAYKGTGGTADPGSLGNPFELDAVGGLLDGTPVDRYPTNEIPKNAFANHSTIEKKSRFTSITLPSTVTSIGGNSFYRCNSLTSITIPDNVASIHNNAFYDCSGLVSVILSGHVTNIGMAAFCGCNSLKSIIIPRSLVSIGNGAFSGSNVVFTVDKSNTKYSSVDGVLFDKTQTKLIQCPISKKGSYSIPNTVNSIGIGAFKNCKDLLEVTVPKSVTSIDASVFYGCSGLTSIAIPNSVTFIGAYAFYGCNGLTSLIIPNSVKSIINCAFQDCSSLTSVAISNSLTSIDQNVFTGCISLKTVSIPGLVTTIGIQAFSDCKGLKSIAIPNSVTSIGMWAFSGCSGLSSVTIPSSVKSIGLMAFYCSSGEFLVDAGNTNYSSMDGVLLNKNQTLLVHCSTSKKGSYSLPNTVTSIGDGAFVECNNLTTVVVPEMVNSISYCSFSGSSAVVSVDSGNSNYTNVDGVLFNKNQTILLHCPITRTGSYSIPNTVTSITDFGKCVGLTSIIIPESVTTIGGSCFNYCSGLTSITVKSSTPVELSPFVSVFYKIDKKSCKLYVPVGSKSLYQAANQWKYFENIIETNLN